MAQAGATCQVPALRICAHPRKAGGEKEEGTGGWWGQG